MPDSHYTVSSGSEHIVYLNEGDHIIAPGRSVHSPASTESQSGRSSAGSWAHIERPDYDGIKPSDSASRSRHSSIAPTPAAPIPPTRRHSSRASRPDELHRHSSHRSRSHRHHRGESRRSPSDESASIVASGDDYPYAGMPPPQQRGHYRHPPAGYPPSVGSAAPYDAFSPQALVHMPTDPYGYPTVNPFVGGQPNPFASMPPPSSAGYFPPEGAPQPPRPHPTHRMSMYAASPPGYADMYHAQMMTHQPYPMYPPQMGYMHPPSQPASPPPAEANNSKEFESLREIIKKHEEERLAWEKAMVARAEAEAATKAAEKAKAEEEAKKKQEIETASAKAKEAAEKKAEEAAKKAKEEADKKLAEAQKAKEEAEKKSKELEDEKKKNAPAPDASKEPIRFKDACNRKFSFPWAVCKTWKGMEGLVKQAFTHIEPFGRHVLEGRYDMVGPDGEIILPQVWETTVKPGWEIEMVMWPMDELEAPKSGRGDPLADFNLDDLLALSVQPQKPAKAGKSAKAGKEKKDKGKKNIVDVPMRPPVPPIDPLADFANLFPGPIPRVMKDTKPVKSGTSSKSKGKDLPPLMRWMTGGAPAPKKK